MTDVANGPTVEREAALLKVHAPTARRPEILALAEAFEAKVVDVGTSTLVIEVTGPPGKVDKIAELARPYGLKELVRTGRIVMARGARSIRPAMSAQRTARGDGESTGAAPPWPWAWQADGVS